MTVGELIEALSKLDPRLPVVGHVGDDFGPEEITDVDVDLSALSNEPTVYLR